MMVKSGFSTLESCLLIELMPPFLQIEYKLRVSSFDPVDRIRTDALN